MESILHCVRILASIAMIARAVALDSFHIRAMPPANAARRSPSPPCAAPRPMAFGQPYWHLHVLERAPTRTGESGAAATTKSTTKQPPSSESSTSLEPPLTRDWRGRQRARSGSRAAPPETDLGSARAFQARDTRRSGHVARRLRPHGLG